MSYLQAIVLGALQGLAEFLPISSSGHLYLAKVLFNLEEVPLLFDIILHVATLLAVCIVFWPTIKSLFLSFMRFCLRKNTADDASNLRSIAMLLVATVITAAIGIPFDGLDLGIRMVFVGFLYTSFILIISHLYTNSKKSQPVKAKPWPLQAFIIGLMQGFAVLPGISRSGSTISAALFSGLNRKEAGEFSFILSIPAILGGLLLHLKDLGEMNSSISFGVMTASFISSFLFGFIALKFLVRLIQNGKLYYFAFYLIPLAVVGLIFL